MVNMNHFQQVFFLSRYTNLTIIAGRYSDFRVSAAKGTGVIRSPIKGRLGFLVWSVYWFWKNRRRQKFDVVITEPSLLSLAGYAAKIFTRSKWVIDIWDIPVRYWAENPFLQMKARMSKLILKHFFNYADFFIISILPDFELRYFNLPQEKSIYLPNAIWLNRRDYKNHKSTNENEFNILVMRSKYSLSSGLDVLSSAFVELNQRYENVSLTVVGRMSAVVRKQVDHLRRLKDVRFYDFVDHDDLLQMIDNSGVCVVPYHAIPDLSQIYPIKILEYRAMGAVIIAADLPNFRRMIRNGETGLLFQPGNARDLAEKISQVIENPDLRRKLSENAKQIERQFDCVEKNNIILDALKGLVYEDAVQNF